MRLLNETPQQFFGLLPCSSPCCHLECSLRNKPMLLKQTCLKMMMMKGRVPEGWIEIGDHEYMNPPLESGQKFMSRNRAVLLILQHRKGGKMKSRYTLIRTFCISCFAIIATTSVSFAQQKEQKHRFYDTFLQLLSLLLLFQPLPRNFRLAG